MREFSVSGGNQTVSSTSTMIVWVNAPASPNVNIEYLRYWIGQSANATSAQQRIQLITQVSTFPSMTASTPSKLKNADAVSVIVGSTSGGFSTAGITGTATGAGATTAVWDDAFNVLNGWLHVATPPETRVMPAGGLSGQGMYFPTAPSTLTGWAYGLVYREV